jgi:hypothetical protein
MALACKDRCFPYTLHSPRCFCFRSFYSSPGMFGLQAMRILEIGAGKGGVGHEIENL